MSIEHISQYMREAVNVVTNVDPWAIETAIKILKQARSKGKRVFVLGLGGSAGSASHMVNDLRKICGIEAYSPTDNMSEFTAWCNDASLDDAFVESLKVSKLRKGDCVIFLSGSGGGIYGDKSRSKSLMNALDYARSKDSLTIAMTGDEEGYLHRNANISLCPVSKISPKYSENFYGHAEEIPVVVWHCIVNDPELKNHG